MKIPNQSAGIIRSAPGTSLRGGVVPSIFWGVVIGAAIVFTFGPEVIGVVVDEITGKIGDFPVPEEGADTPA
jgi:hypothetical protein